MFQKASGRCELVQALKRITFQESLAVMPRDSVICLRDMFCHEAYKLGGTANFRPLASLAEGLFLLHSI